MENINNYFNNLKKEIYNAKYRKALIVLKKQAKRFADSFDNPNYNVSIKRTVKRQYYSVIKLINRMYKRLKT